MRSMRSSKRSSRGRKRVAARPTATRRRLVSLIKRVAVKTAEPKERHAPFGKTEVYHNAFYSGTVLNTGFVWQLNASNLMPQQGTQDFQRVGDQIMMSGFKVKLLMGQKADRPNVNWRWMVLVVPKGSSITYANWFTATTNNVMLDDANKDFVRTIKAGVWRPNEAGLVGGSADEYTFTKKLWIPYKKTIKFGPALAATTHNDDDVYLVIMAYDAFGSLQTDNIGYIEGSQTIHYRDP